ncbi:hypothetical protein FB639_003565 [Coemansia asiatica]|nr:hypothetical protein FB639_003565 [Coemansia asiatica]
MNASYQSQHPIAASAYHIRPQRREAAARYSTSDMHALPPLPIAIPLPSSSGLGSSKNKMGAPSSKAYPGNGPLSVVTSRLSESPVSSFTAVNSPGLKTQPSHSNQQQQQQQQQQQYKYSSQPLTAHQHQYEQHNLTKRMQHLSFPLTGSASVPKSEPQAMDPHRYQFQTHWHPERSSSYGLKTQPEHDGPGSGDNYQLYSSQQPYQHAASQKTQPQNLFSQNLRHSLQHGYHRRTPSQTQSQMQGQHQHQYQRSPRHSSSHYEQNASAPRNINPRSSHLHSSNQYHHAAGTHAGAAAAALNGSLPMSLPVVSTLSSNNNGFGKKQRQKKCVTFADPIAEFHELPLVCSMSAPTSSVLSSGSILKKSPLTRSMVADDHGAGSNGGGLLAYERSRMGLRGSESRRSRSSSQPMRYGGFDSFYALDSPAHFADYERNAYWDPPYDDGHVCNDPSCSGYKYDSRFSLSTDYLPLNEQYSYC